MRPAQVAAYLRRLGVEPSGLPTDAGGAPSATIEVLRDLHLRHLRTVPFENLSIHLEEEIVLEEERLLEKVVGARRGGFCYELNGAFGVLLTALGFDVTLLAGRVYGEEGRLGIPYDHLALRVRTVDGDEWLADVGFGAHSHYPLAFGAREEQDDPGGTFRVVEAGPDAAGVRSADLDIVVNGRPQYRLEPRPRVLGDFVAGAWWHSSSPQSHFTQSLVCSRVTEDGGRITLSGRTFKTTAADGTREERELDSAQEVLAVYREQFGVELDRVPVVRSADRRG
ncbi:arylamine N-acetyltransferase [Streptomyces sp. NPDC006602]|uniref:arylamine N-acetyltransferase family protein n=1 Tax=Streptomyces sp. NPDC006602 TaxID=3364751 RepID=UPI00368563AB